jgi:hypothetical protein
LREGERGRWRRKKKERSRGKGDIADVCLFNKRKREMRESEQTGIRCEIRERSLDEREIPFLWR